MSELQTNLKDRCRICLDTDGGNVLLSTKVGVDEHKMMISDMLICCTGLHISIGDEKPQGICLQCSAKTYKLYQFREICMKTDLILQNELDSQKGFKLEENKIELHSELELGIEESEVNLITDDNTNGSTETSTISEKPTLTHDAASTNQKVVILKPQRRKLESHKCRYCGINFSLSSRSTCKRTQSQHTRKHINKKIINKTSESLRTKPRYGCSVCKKSFRSTKDVMDHKCISKKAHKCSQCSKEFASGSKLTEHARVHSEEKPYVCSHCSKCFIQKSDLTKHERSHTGEKPYQCAECRKRFTHRHHLDRHTVTHNGKKPHECSYCSRRFAQVSNLIIHKRTHTGEKPYGCSYCAKSFARQGELSRHERIHTGEKPYACSHCTKSFARLDYLLRHKRIHSGEDDF